VTVGRSLRKSASQSALDFISEYEPRGIRLPEFHPWI